MFFGVILRYKNRYFKRKNIQIPESGEKKEREIQKYIEKNILRVQIAVQREKEREREG